MSVVRVSVTYLISSHYIYTKIYSIFIYLYLKISLVPFCCRYAPLGRRARLILCRFYFTLSMFYNWTAISQLLCDVCMAWKLIVSIVPSLIIMISECFMIPKNNNNCAIHLTLFAGHVSKCRPQRKKAKTPKYFIQIVDTHVRIWYFSSEHFSQALSPLTVTSHCWGQPVVMAGQYSAVPVRAVSWVGQQPVLKLSSLLEGLISAQCQPWADEQTKYAAASKMFHLFRMRSMSRLPMRPGPRLWPLLS